LQVLDNFGCQHGRIWQIGGIAKAVIAEPEDIEIGLIALDQVCVVEGSKALSLAPLVTPHGIVAADKVVQVGKGEAVGLQGEVLVGAEVMDP